ncbi:MAG: type II toxin-antitoxin system Phd/YefM family antitoxin [Gomphosphaeria aponina SAG 52.96 = DSM 107014]|uniref:Antitoxin n=1 Tax=Gomphosphaeria aponina SAG 52.96 = DSM 107014 TaxID=1521640 RepID=A0A941GMQ0_9CHRO|nr:type II toxin-antitoxin system Phd/YefM family antitoxin [Gomphosphaeria aponina SAG 52.96 = DSM 107014]
MPKYLNISEIQNKLPQLVEDKNSEPAIITKEGKPVIIAFNIEQFDALLETLEILADQELMTDIKEGIRQLEKGETIPLEELEVELGLIED